MKYILLLTLLIQTGYSKPEQLNSIFKFTILASDIELKRDISILMTSSSYIEVNDDINSKVIQTRIKLIYAKEPRKSVSLSYSLNKLKSIKIESRNGIINIGDLFKITKGAEFNTISMSFEGEEVISKITFAETEQVVNFFKHARKENFNKNFGSLLNFSFKGKEDKRK